MLIPNDENNYGEEKVALLIKRIQYLKQNKYKYKFKDTDLSEIVLTAQI